MFADGSYFKNAILELDHVRVENRGTCFMSRRKMELFIFLIISDSLGMKTATNAPVNIYMTTTSLSR